MALCLGALVAGTAACSSSEGPAAGGSSTTAADGGGAGGSTSVAPASGGGGGSTTSMTVAPHGELPTVDLSDEEQAYVDAMVAQPPSNMDEEQARCVASHWIQAVGVDTVEASGITVEDIEDGTSTINDIAVDEAMAEKIVDSYETCEFDIVALVATGFTGATGGDPAKQACVEGVITPDVARRYLVLALTGIAQGGSPELVEIQALVEPCLV